MKGIMMKDLYSLQPYKMTFLFMIALAVGASIFLDMGNSYVPMMMMMFLLVSSLSLYTVDENSNWDRFAITMPVTRFQIVAARYLFLLVCFLALFALNLLLSWGVNIVKPQGPWLIEALATNAVMGACFLFVNSIIAPLCYKLGAEKSRLLMMLAFLVPFLGTVFGMPYIIPFLAARSTVQLHLLGGGFVVALLLLYLLSAQISTRIYAKKEF